MSNFLVVFHTEFKFIFLVLNLGHLIFQTLFIFCSISSLIAFKASKCCWGNIIPGFEFIVLLHALLRRQASTIFPSDFHPLLFIIFFDDLGKFFFRFFIRRENDGFALNRGRGQIAPRPPPAPWAPAYASRRPPPSHTQHPPPHSHPRGHSPPP